MIVLIGKSMELQSPFQISIAKARVYNETATCAQLGHVAKERTCRGPAMPARPHPQHHDLSRA